MSFDIKDTKVGNLINWVLNHKVWAIIIFAAIVIFVLAIFTKVLRDGFAPDKSETVSSQTINQTTINNVTEGPSTQNHIENHQTTVVVNPNPAPINYEKKAIEIKKEQGQEKQTLTSKREIIVNENSPQRNTNQTFSAATYSTARTDYLIVGQNLNQINGLVSELQGVVELTGATATISNSQSIEVSLLKGQYKKLIKISGSLSTIQSSLDKSVLSAAFVFAFRIYEVESSKLINYVSDKIVEVGFSELEVEEKIKKTVIQKIKPLL